MPADDVSDLQDVFDAINKLCETMKSSNYEDAPPRPEGGDGPVSPGAARSPDHEDRSEAESVARSQFVSAEDLSVQRMETQRQKWRESQASLASSEREPADERWSDAPEPAGARRADRWSDCRVSPPGLREDAACELASELYYTASSDVSLLSEPEPERPPEPDREGKVVVAGHVAAMRERFESMTRAGTPAPADPALDALRNVTPSPDLLR